MSRRIAHRPRYRNMYLMVPSAQNARQHLFRARWAYRRQRAEYEKRPLGYALSMLAFPVR